MAVSVSIKAVLGTVLMAGVATAMSLAAAHDDLRRCEDGNGHVTYSNEACPSGTARERSVDNRPAVEVRRDAAAEKAVRGSGILPSPQAVTRDAGALQEMDQEKRRALVARCDDLVHRIEYGQQDLLSAAPGERASVELGIRRLQEEHASNCAPPKPAQP